MGLFGYSVYKGLDKGIKNLSNFNLILALVFLLIILFSTDIIGLIQTSVSGLLFSITHFWDMSTLGISKESHISTKNKKAPIAIPNIPQQEQSATDVSINFELSFHSSMIL